MANTLNKQILEQSTNDDFDFDRILKDQNEREKRMSNIEEDGIKNILKHFDRIHDNLFNFNNVLIAGYFALAQIDNTVPVKTIIIPIINLIILIIIEYKMMEKSRTESNITKLTHSEIERFEKAIDSTNRYSLITICSSLIVTLIFLYYLMR